MRNKTGYLGVKQSYKQSSQKIIFNETALFIEGEEGLKEPWGVGMFFGLSVHHWLVQGAENASFTRRGIPGASWTYRKREGLICNLALSVATG